LLLYGAFEMSFTNKAIVIDVLIKLTKKYSPDESYKFINSILDKVGKYYEKIKNNKK
jgi:transcription termination factor NusB